MPLHTFTKIMSSIGPASEDPKMLEKLLKAGVDVCRMNFSHDIHENHKVRYNHIRALSKKLKRPIAIVADLQGAKHRIGTFKEDKVTIKPGQKFTLYLKKIDGDKNGVTLPHKEVFESLKKGSTILIDDGRVALKAEKVSKNEIETKVVYGTELSERKGFNIPDTILKMSALTPKDRKDLDFALKLGVDYVALSFVQTVEDVLEARKIIGDKAKIIVKVEKPSACDDIENITRACDVIMVARGDLAIETSPSQIPVLQRKIIETCRRLGKPVILATDVFDSMTKKPMPTRAELNDCGTAVYLGADAIMTSGETAAGNYPEEVVKMMAKVIEDVENSENYRDNLNPRHTDLIEFTTDEALALSSADITDLVGAKAIVAFTHSGNMARKISAYRPEVPVIALTTNPKVANQLNMAYGVKSAVLDKTPIDVNDMEKLAIKHAKSLLGLKSQDQIIMTAGKKTGSVSSPNKEGYTNLLTVITL
ncbi:MAG: pyruvate kinase [Alphaproteobacteria bacterium]|nr:pyruvate kinase [Alphaproteobacteria bacterium]